MACIDQCAVVLNDLLYDCENKSVGGILQTVKLINRCDINVADWTINNGLTPTCTHNIAYSAIDPVALNAVTVQGIPGKRLLNAGYSSVSQDFGWYFTHFVNLFNQGLTEASLCNVKAFGEGADVIAIVEQNAKGTNNLDAFVVYGWDTGLKLGDMTYDSNENNGNSIIPLTSLDPDLERFPPMILRMTDYATTKTFFDGL